MSWILRKAAAALYGEPPSGTIDEALENFLRAEELQPEFFSTNALYVGKVGNVYPNVFTTLKPAGVVFLSRNLF